MADGRLDFEFGFGKTGRPPSDEQPFRILVLADLAAEGVRSKTLDQRSPVSIDVDSIETVMARVSPKLAIELGAHDSGDEKVQLGFGHVDDFHPDALFRRSEVFAAMRRMREELQDPGSFNRAALALGLGVEVATGATPAESDDETLTRLLGRAPNEQAVASPGVVERLLREAVSAHVVTDDSTVREQALAEFDARIAEHMRGILHNPAYQQLEATWRGVWRLATELESSDTLQVAILDVSRVELQADLLEHAGAAMRRVLVGPETEEAGPWSLLIGDFSFTANSADLAMLTALADLAGETGVPCLVGGQPGLVGCTTTEDLGQPAQWPALPAETEAAWRVLRESDAAVWLGLAMPRLLLRLPYGAATDPIESFAFEELADGRAQDHYLWGNPVYALATLAGQAFAEEGWQMAVSARLEIASLPSHVYRDETGEPRQQPCAETWLSESAAEVLLERGIMPLISYRNRDAARLLRWQSVASPARALAGVMGA